MRYLRKVIRIRAEDSPNVRRAQEYLRRGLQVPEEMVLPGVLSYQEYKKRRATWDKVRQCVGLDAQFYKGAKQLLYPPDWLNAAEQYADSLSGRHRTAKAVGIDPAEGGDKTSMAAVDELGLIELVSRSTPDTSEITGEAIAFGRKWGVPPEQWIFDRGGGGKEHADRLRKQGYDVRTVAFGESVMLDIKRGMVMVEERREIREERYAYRNRRAEMYGALRELLDPATQRAKGVDGFGIPAEYAELRRQLAPIPMTYDDEGRMYLLPKTKRNPSDTRQTLTELIGCSPDDADALVLAVYGMTHKQLRATAGAI